MVAMICGWGGGGGRGQGAWWPCRYTCLVGSSSSMHLPAPEPCHCLPAPAPAPIFPDPDPDPDLICSSCSSAPRPTCCHTWPASPPHSGAPRNSGQHLELLLLPLGRTGLSCRAHRCATAGPTGVPPSLPRAVLLGCHSLATWLAGTLELGCVCVCGHTIPLRQPACPPHLT